MKHNILEFILNWLNRPTKSFGSNEAEVLGALASSVGNVRQENQDRAIIARYTGRFPAESFVFYGLCDGIGGLRDGGFCASQGLASALVSMVGTGDQNLPNKMMSAAYSANENIYNSFHENGGCTYSAIASDFRGEIVGINVGDSRIYSRGEGQICQVSSDDNIGSQLQLLGNIGKSTGEFSKQLTQFLGMGQSLQPKRVFLQDGKRGFLLTSDGVHYLGEKLLTELSSSAQNPAQLAERIATVATWCKGTDNGTVVCISSRLKEIFRKSASETRGLLEIWDSFEKLHVFVDSDELRRPYFPTQKSAVTHANHLMASQGEKKKPFPKKKKAFTRKHDAPEIEITENPVQ